MGTVFLRWWHRWIVLGMVAVVAIAISAGPAAVSAQVGTPSAVPPVLTYPELTIAATDSAFTLTPQITAGRFLVTLENTGSDQIEAAIIRLPKGATAAQFEAALTTPTAASVSPIIFIGGPGGTPAGGRTQAIIDFTAGQYVVTTLSDSPSLVAGLEVVASGTPVAAPAAPPVDLHVTLKNFSFGLPAQVAAGFHVWQVTNSSDQPHQMILERVPDGTTLAQVKEALTRSPNGTPPPNGLTSDDFVPVGGLAELSSDLTAWAVVDLAPGRYLAISFDPDLHKSGTSQALEGMIELFDAVGPSPLPTGSTVTTTTATNLRAAPSLTGQIVTTLPQGAPLVVTGSPQPAGGTLWYPVRDANDQSVTGFVADFLLAKAP